MAEVSKKRGEFGEEIVDHLLNLIGWQPNLKGVDVDCMRPIEHAISTKNRVTHGIDFVFQYDSPFFTDTKDFVLVSSKFNDEYPSNPVTKFKSHLKDLAFAMECFKKSSLKNKLSEFNKTNKYTGVIFWLDNGKDKEYDDVIDRLTDFRVEDGVDFESIYLVDNRRADFLFQAITHASHFFKKSEVEFLIPNTGHNSTVKTRKSSSSILPAQYINSSILPLKVIQKDGTQEILVLNIIDEFEEGHLPHLISLAQKLTEGWSNQVFLLYPRYVKDTFGESVEKAKLEFRDQAFVRKIQVGSYMPDFRNV
jgi:hypothetical protein